MDARLLELLQLRTAGSDDAADQIQESVLRELPWQTIRDNVLLVLSREDHAELHREALVLVWIWTLNEGVPREDRVHLTAAVYHWLNTHRLRFMPAEREEIDNLVWSIASALWELPYDATWDPRDVPEVAMQLDELAARERTGGPFR